MCSKHTAASREEYHFRFLTGEDGFTRRIPLIYAVVIELVPWPPCPLSMAEAWLEARAGIEPAHGPFLCVYSMLLFIPTCRNGSSLAARCLFAWQSYRCLCGAIIVGQASGQW